MGVHPLIGHNTFPIQSEAVGQFVEVRFPGEETERRCLVVRDDVNFPRLNRRIIRMDDGRYLLVIATNDPDVARICTERSGYLDETENPAFANGGYPKQGSWHTKRAEVCFRYDASHTIMGTYVRDDDEKPYETIIALDDGRFVLTAECQHRPL